MKPLLLGMTTLAIKAYKKDDKSIDNFFVFVLKVEDGTEPYSKRFIVTRRDGGITSGNDEEIIYDMEYAPKDDLLGDYLTFAYDIMEGDFQPAEKSPFIEFRGERFDIVDEESS